MNVKSEKNRLLLADVIVQCWKSPEYIRKLAHDPKGVLEQEGIEGISEDIQINVLENTVLKKHLVLPADQASITFFPVISEIIRKSLPLLEGQQVNIVQNTSRVVNIVIPMAPRVSGINIDASHAQLLLDIGWEAINLWTTANAAAEVNAVVWANAAAVTLAVAVAAIVLI